MSLTPHHLSSCCGVPVIPSGNINIPAKCSNCGLDCDVIEFDDGWREHVGYSVAIPVKPKIRVVMFNIINQTIAVVVTPATEINIIIRKADYIDWGLRKGYISLMPQVAYESERDHHERQPHEINIKENLSRKNRFYRSANKKLLTEYIRDNNLST